jgi:hypothetical protein
MTSGIVADAVVVVAEAVVETGADTETAVVGRPLQR